MGWSCPVRSALKRTPVQDFYLLFISFYYIISSRYKTVETYGSDVAPGINVAPGTLANILIITLKIGISHQIVDILKKKYVSPSLIRNVARGKMSKN